MVEYIEISSEKKAPTNESKLPHNLLVSGAPGTGKSYYLGKSLLDAGEALINAAVLGGMSTERAKKQYCDEFVTRVTFYEDYSYENFVGCYKPVPDNSEATILYDNKDGKITENKITYKFVAGPFIDTYLKAKKDKEHNYFLIIEEINRAKAASVFGDMFQLLDRKDGESVYEIQPDAALREYLEIHGEDGLMKLPSNMYIWATMNSADQGVMPLDSAFKRRWASLYMDINNDEAARVAYITVTSDKKILWESLRTKINQVILSNGFDEDRCIGAWYFSEEEISQINAFFTKTAEDRRNAVNPLVDKLFYYLRQDVFRRNPSAMFKPNDGEENGITMSDIRRRIRMGETLDGILNLKDLQWE